MRKRSSRLLRCKLTKIINDAFGLKINLDFQVSFTHYAMQCVELGVFQNAKGLKSWKASACLEITNIGALGV